jgi:hypothetical protein
MHSVEQLRLEDSCEPGRYILITRSFDGMEISYEDKQPTESFIFTAAELRFIAAWLELSR